MKENLEVIKQFKIDNPSTENTSTVVLSFRKSSIAPNDHNKLLGCKTPIYLDLYNGRSIFTWMLLMEIFAIPSVCSIPIFWYIEGKLELYFLLVLVPFWILLLQVIYYVVIPPPLPKMRFNRQCRQVYIDLGKGHARYVNWNELIPVYGFYIGPKSRGPGSSTLNFYIKDDTNSSGYKKLYTELNLANIEVVIAQWECIRNFMEEEHDACPESKYNCTYFEQGDDVKATVKNWIRYRKHPTFSNPEVIEWSK